MICHDQWIHVMTYAVVATKHNKNALKLLFGWRKSHSSWFFPCLAVSFRFGSDSENAQEKSDEELEPLSMKEVVRSPSWWWTPPPEMFPWKKATPFHCESSFQTCCTSKGVVKDLVFYSCSISKGVSGASNLNAMHQVTSRTVLWGYWTKWNRSFRQGRNT